MGRQTARGLGNGGFLLGFSWIPTAPHTSTIPAGRGAFPPSQSFPCCWEDFGGCSVPSRVFSPRFFLAPPSRCQAKCASGSSTSQMTFSKGSQWPAAQAFIPKRTQPKGQNYRGIVNGQVWNGFSQIPAPNSNNGASVFMLQDVCHLLIPCQEHGECWELIPALHRQWIPERSTLQKGWTAHGVQLGWGQTGR